MRYLTVRYLTVAAAAVLAAGISTAASSAADPTDPTDPTSTEPTTAAPETPAPSGTPTAAPETSTAPSATSTASGAHQVTYTVTTTSDLTANIYYVTADPPDQASANTAQYMPMVRIPVGPGAPWTVQTSLDDPTRWAFVSASGGLRVNPEFHCEIAVDGQVVVSQQGGSGVQCALRPW